MKKIIITLIVLASFVVNCFSDINNTTDYLLFDAERAIGVIGLNEPTEIMVVYLPESVSSNIYSRRHIDGTVYLAINGTYVVMIAKELSENLASITLIHELAHIKQMQDGRLKLDKKGRIVGWKGKEYKVNIINTPPWEVEADVMIRKTIKQLKCIC